MLGIKSRSNVLSLSVLAGLAVCVGAEAAPHGIVYTRQVREQKAAEDLIEKTLTPFTTTKLDYHGGPVLSQVKAYNIFWGSNVDSATQQQIGAAVKALVNSTQMDMLNQYATRINSIDGRAGTQQDIKHGTLGGDILITPHNTSRSLQDADVGKELEKQITEGKIPHPDANSLYLVYFPAGITISIDGAQSCQVFCGYHHKFESTTVGKFYFGVMPDLGGACSFGCGFATTKFDDLTTIVSHEVIEAITDPDSPNSGNDIVYPLAWMTKKGEEIGDLCADKLTTLSVAGSTSAYTIQQEFDNSIHACNPAHYSAAAVH